MSRPTRAEVVALQAQIEALRNIGAQLSNVAFNWAQQCGYTLTSDDCQMLDKLRKEWDASNVPREDSHG